MQLFIAVLGGKFHQMIDLTDTDVDVDKLTNSFNTAIGDTVTEVLGKCQRKTKLGMTDDILALRDEQMNILKYKTT